MKNELKKFVWSSALLVLGFATALLPTRAFAQDWDQQDDPPTRVARLGYIEGSFHSSQLARRNGCRRSPIAP